jgi:hypothetical protein
MEVGTAFLTGFIERCKARFASPARSKDLKLHAEPFHICPGYTVGRSNPIEPNQIIYLKIDGSSV